MANNKIQIKRSVANSVVTGLSNGELAYTQASNTLWIGLPDGSGTAAIGGARYPGTLTANQAIVTNATSGVDRIIVANAIVTTLTANGSVGTNGQVLVTNGSAIYWGTGTSGSNTYIQFNDSGVANGVAGFTFDKTQNNLFVANSLLVGNTSLVSPTAVVNTTVIYVGNSVGNTTQNTTSFFISGNGTTLPTATMTSNGLVVGNGSVIGAPQLILANSAGNTVVNTTSYTMSNANYVVLVSNTSGIFANQGTIIYAGNTTANTTQNSSSFFITGNTTTLPTTTLTSSGLVVGNNSVTGQPTINIANSVGNTVVSVTSYVLSNSTANVITIGTSGITGNTGTSIVIGNTTINSVSNSSTFQIVGNTSTQATATVNSNGITVGNTSITGTPNIYVANSVGNVTINTNSIAIGGNATTMGAVSVTGNGAIFGNGTVTAAPQLAVSNSTGNTVINTTSYLMSNSSGTVYSMNTTSMTFNGNTFLNGTNTTIASNVTVTGAYVNAPSTDLTIRNVSVGGNLVVTGTVFSVNTVTLQVNDNIIELADNNNSSDVVDTGWFSPAGNTTNVWYSGLVRQASKSSNSNPYFWLFGSNTNPNTAITVDTSANSSTGTLQAYLVPYGVGGGFVANSSNVQITANSTLGVNIVANTLTLSTALAGTEGGTGYKTVTNNAILVGNSTNGYNQLTLGTSGYVLQSNGTTVVFDYLDGGSF